MFVLYIIFVHTLYSATPECEKSSSTEVPARAEELRADHGANRTSTRTIQRDIRSADWQRNSATTNTEQIAFVRTAQRSGRQIHSKFQSFVTKH